MDFPNFTYIDSLKENTLLRFIYLSFIRLSRFSVLKYGFSKHETPNLYREQYIKTRTHPIIDIQNHRSRYFTIIIVDGKDEKSTSLNFSFIIMHLQEMVEDTGRTGV